MYAVVDGGVALPVEEDQIDESGDTSVGPVDDAVIAASAQHVGARLATGNPSDFPMDEITVEHWPVGA